MHFLIHLVSAVFSSSGNGTYLPPQTPFDLFTNLMAYSAIIPIALFIYYYGTRPAPGHKYKRRISSLWRTTQIGRTLMYQMFAWLLYLLFITVNLLFSKGDYFGKVEIRFAIYFYLVFLFWRLFITLRRVQTEHIKLDAESVGVNLDSSVEDTQSRKSRS